jgi:nucleotide-binding universal stress UspA family protein
MKTKNKILVALDLDEQAMIALQYAAYFAEKLDYELEAITVVEESNILSKLFASDELVIKLNQGIKDKVDKAIAPYKGNIKINANIAYGKPYEKIMETARQIKPCLIFMGKSELSKQNQLLLGSNSMHVILEAGFPVVTIRGDFDFNTYKKEHKEILLPLDLKKGIAEQVTAAIEFAKLLKTSIRVFSIQTSGGKGREAKMLTQVAQTKKTIIDAGITCNAEIINSLDGDITELINQQVMEHKAAMIIIMTRSENKITELIIGSKASDIINKSNIPVMSIGPWDLESGSEVFSLFFDPLNIINK